MTQNKQQQENSRGLIYGVFLTLGWTVLLLAAGFGAGAGLVALLVWKGVWR